MHRIGEDTTERLDAVPTQLKVIGIRRPKYRSRACEGAVVRAPAPARLIEDGMPTAPPLARILGRRVRRPPAPIASARSTPGGNRAGSLDARRLGRQGRRPMPNTKLAHSPAERALALMRALGIPNSASTLYVTLLRASALPTEKAAEMAGLTPAATKQAMEYLKLFRLVAQDVVHGEAVLFAGDPRTAWKAHDADFYWAHSNHIGDIETLPPLSGVADEKRRRLYAELEELCGSIYDVNPHSHDPLSHQHRDIYSGEMFASWLAAAISAAEKEIVAVEKPPRLPDLAPIWVATSFGASARVSPTQGSLALTKSSNMDLIL